MAESQIVAKPYTSTVGASGGTRGMEDNFFEPTTSAFSHKLAELSIWPNENSISYLHGLDFDRARTGDLLVRLPRDARSIWVEYGAREKSSAGHRILDMGRRFHHDRASFRFADANRAASHSKVARDFKFEGGRAFGRRDAII